jgi:hypothetical protein
VTRARVLTVGTASRTNFAACRRLSPETSFPAGARIVERTSRYGISYTLRVAPRLLFGCDLRPASRRGSFNACALAVGKLSSGRLLDPRLTLSCGFDQKRPLAFAWVTPLAATRWVVITGESGDEAYRTLGGLPVRVAISDGVSVHDAAATIEIKELTADGKLLTQGTERVVVAG